MINFLKGIFSKALRLVNALLRAVFTSAFKILLSRLQNVATETIKRLADTDLSNSEKREQAFNEIKSYAIKEVLKFNDRDIFLIIETIFSALKNEKVIK